VGIRSGDEAQIVPGSIPEIGDYARRYACRMEPRSRSKSRVPRIRRCSDAADDEKKGGDDTAGKKSEAKKRQSGQ